MRLSVEIGDINLSKDPYIIDFFNMLCVTELPEVFLTLGTKLGLVLSFFTLRRDLMDLNRS